MPYYAVPGSLQTTTSSYKTAAAPYANATATKRGKMTEFYMGAVSTPNSSDQALQFDISRMQATGALAGTAWTPTQNDSADGASQFVSTIVASAETTGVTANSSLYNIGINQRNTLRIMFPQESQYLIWPATCANGFVLRATSAGFTTSWDAGCTIME